MQSSEALLPSSNENYKRFVEHVTAVYAAVKQHDIPDTRIVRYIFPRHGIFVSYRQWMNIKRTIINEPAGKELIEKLSQPG